jgi:hypothetical protein
MLGASRDGERGGGVRRPGRTRELAAPPPARACVRARRARARARAEIR